MASKLKPFEVPQSILDTPGAFPADASDLQTVGTSAPQSLSAALRARKDEFTRKKTMKVKVGSWNAAALSGTEKDLGLWFVKGLGVRGLSEGMAALQRESSIEDTGDSDIEGVEDQEDRRRTKKPTIPHRDKPAVPHDEEVGLYVLGLQEVIDISSVTEAIKPYTDPNPAKKWKTALRSCLPRGYEKVAEQQLLGLLILVFASPEIYPTIGNVSCTSVGTGLGGYLGNKGAVSVRIVLGESTRMCFVNCHLAAGADAASLQRRIWDANQIVQRTRFNGVALDGEEDGQEEKLGDEDFAFWFGDLNYRLDDIPGEDVRRLLLLHTRNEYDILNKSKQKIDSELGYQPAQDGSIDVNTTDGPQPVDRYEYSTEELPAGKSQAEPDLDPKSDPASLLTTINSLLAHDQLQAQQRQKTAFHDGWREGEIHFLPTYKYDVGSVGMFDSGEKKRSPSWCDRILFRTRVDRLMYEERAAKEAAARQKDEDMKKRGLDAAADEQDVLFDYDPDTDGLAYGDDYDEETDEMHDAELVETHGGRDDEIALEHYFSHQRVLSSDHKPIDAVFNVTYDAVVPDLKAKIHAEVARELDKAENEARPTITVVTENHSDARSNASDAGDITETSTNNITTRTESDVNCINYASVRYDIPKTRSITVANTGQLPCTFNFVGRSADPVSSPEDAAISPTWLTISTLDPSDPDAAEYAAPNKDYNLNPGDTLTLHLTAHIDASLPSLVETLNAGTASLDEVLILRVSSGRDHFLPLRGTWLPSCFHRSLDELVVAPVAGVRAMPRRPNNRDGTGTMGLKSSPSANTLSQGRNSAPRELFALTEAVQTLAERALVDWGMVHPDEPAPWTRPPEKGAWPFSEGTWTLETGEERDTLKARVREALDTAQPLSDALPPETECIVRLEVVAETLIQFLASVRGSIITVDMFSSILTQLTELEKERGKSSAVSAEDKNAIVMEALSTRPVHSVSLTFVIFMLVKLLQEVCPLPQDAAYGRRSSAQPVGVASDSAGQHDSGGAGGSVHTATTRSRASTLTSEVDSELSTATTRDGVVGGAGGDGDDPSNSSPGGGGGGGGDDSAGGSKKKSAAAFFSNLARRTRRRAESAASASGGAKTGSAPPSAGTGTDGTVVGVEPGREAEVQAARERRAVLRRGYAGVFAPLVVGTRMVPADTGRDEVVGSGGKGGDNGAGKVGGSANGIGKETEKENHKESAKERKAVLAKKLWVVEGVLEANGG